MIRGQKRIAVIGVAAALVAGGVGAAVAAGGTDSSKTKAHKAHAHAAASSRASGKSGKSARKATRGSARRYWGWSGRVSGKLPKGSGSIAYARKDTAPEETPDHNVSIFHAGGPDGEGN